MGADQGYRGDIALVPNNDNPTICFLMEEWKGNRSNAYWDALVSNARDRKIILVFNGNQHHAEFLFARTPRVDVLDEELAEAEPEPGTLLVPKRAIAEHFRPSLNQLKVLLQRLREAGSLAVTVSGTPAPKAEITIFTRRLRSEEFWQKLLPKQGLDPLTAEFTPQSVILKFWKILQKTMKEIAISGGADFKPVPRETLDARGFLLRQYWPDDATHANREYGRLVLEKLTRI
jgi:hypothetical protein